MKNVLLMSLCALALAGCNGQPRASRGDCEQLRARGGARDPRRHRARPRAILLDLRVKDLKEENCLIVQTKIGQLRELKPVE